MSKVPIKPPKNRSSGSKTSKPKPKTSSKSRSSGGGGSSSGGGGGGGGIKKTNDKPQVAALKKMLSSTLAKGRDTKIASINKPYAAQRAGLLDSYKLKSTQLFGNRLDNEKAEADASFGNLGNRAREATDLLSETAANGVGETDQLRTQLLSARNWDANQNEVNRSYYDTLRSANSAISDLNADTKTAGINMESQRLGEVGKMWENYYNARADAYTQLGNIQANPYSNAYSKKGASSSYAGMAKAAGSAWKNPGVGKDISGWKGSVQPEKGVQNSSILIETPAEAKKRPEGSTLRQW